MVADQSGSGKTLAYLVPLIQGIKEAERAAGGPLTKPRQPRAVVLCPTEELCAQVLLNCRALSRACSLCCVFDVFSVVYICIRFVVLL